MSSSTQFYRNLVGIANIGVGAITIPSSNIQVTGNVYASNALVSPLILGTSLVGTHYGVIAGSNTVSASSITCTSLSAGAGTVSGTHSGSGASLTNLPLNQFSGLTAGGVAYGSATTTIATNSAGTSGQALLSGGAGAPTWGTLGLAYGGTGQTSAQSAINALAGAVTSAQYLRGNGTNVVMSAIQASDVPTLNQNTSGSSGSCTGNSATATTAAACSGNSATATTAASCSGNSATATTAASCSGNSATATSAGALTGRPSITVAGLSTSDGTNGFIVLSNGSGANPGYTAFYNNAGTRVGYCGWNNGSQLMLEVENGYTGWYCSGTFTGSGDVIAYSDAKLKTDLQIIDNALDKVSQINGYTFVRTDKDDKTRKAGLIAQEVRKVLPEVVTESDGTLGVSYGNMVALLVEALKEERKAREALEERISQLELKERIYM